MGSLASQFSLTRGILGLFLVGLLALEGCEVVGTKPGSDSTGQTTQPTAPTGSGSPSGPSYFSVTSDPSGSVSLSWGTVTGASCYNVYRSVASGVAGTLLASPTTTYYSDTSAVTGTTYYYQVSAVTTSGETAPTSQSAAEPGVTLSADTVWSGTVNLSHSVGIPSGRTLTINPGTTVAVTPGSRIEIYVSSGGTLKAQGTATAPIVLKSTSSAPGRSDWMGLGSWGGTLTLQYAAVEYASYGFFAYSTPGGTYSVAHDVFAYCNVGICNYGGGVSPSSVAFIGDYWGFWSYASANLSQCVFQGSPGEAVMSSRSNTALTVSSSNFSGNSSDLQIFDTSAIVNNTIAATGNYPVTLSTQISGTTDPNSTILVTGGVTAPVASAGAGFSYTVTPVAASVSRSLAATATETATEADLRNFQRAQR